METGEDAQLELRPDGEARVSTIDGITVVTLDRPPANAIDIRFAVEIERTLAELEREGTGPVILTGEGACFSAGLDLKAMADYDLDQQNALLDAVNRLCLRGYAFPRPLVTALNGHAIAGGLVLALCGDYRIGVDGSHRIGLAEVRVGISYPAGAMAIVEEEIGPAFRRQTVLTGRHVGPKWALRAGLLDEVVTDKHLMERAMEMAKELGTLPAGGYGRIKCQLRAAPLERIRAAAMEGKDPLRDNWLLPRDR